MEVRIRSRHGELSSALRSAASEKISRLGRFLEGLESAEVHFTEERNPRIAEREICEVTLSGPGNLLRAKASGVDPLSAVERVVDKLEHQIEKAKTRRVRRTHGRRQEHSPPSVPAGDLDDIDDDDGSVRIVKAKQFSIKPMTPEEAVLQMELLAHDFYFFTNADTDRAAVVYRRDDGDIGLIDAS